MKHTLRGALGGAAVAALTLLAGCATLHPAYRDYYDREAAALRQQPVAVVATGCVVRDELFSKFILREPTETAARTLADSASRELRAQGITVTALVMPWICVDPENTSFDVAANPDADSRSLRLPLRGDPAVHTDAKTAAAYRALLTAVAKADVTDDTEAPSKKARGAKLGIDAATADALRAATGATRAWVVDARGGQVSFGKSFTVGMFTAAVAIALGGGVYSIPVDGVGARVSLVDLEQRRLLWKKHVPVRRGDPVEPENFGDVHVAQLFEPFLPAGAVPDAPARALAAPLPDAATAIAPTAGTATPMPTPPAPSALSPPATPKRALVRNRPLPAGDVVVELGEGVAFERGTTVRNANGNWVFVRAAGKSGWALVDELDAVAASGQATAGALQVDQQQ